MAPGRRAAARAAAASWRSSAAGLAIEPAGAGRAHLGYGPEARGRTEGSGATAMVEHRGNGEHPELLERRRQLLVWRSLAALIVVGGALGAVRLVRDLLAGTTPGSLIYQVILLTVNALLLVLVVARLRRLRRPELPP
jgi:hypothetical protein